VKRILLRLCFVVVLVYLALVGITFAAMHRDPIGFSHFMMGMGEPLMRITPFPPLWKIARAGNAKTGEMAPDFELATTDHKERIRLSSFRGARPVVLVFGSYT
jgi:hypothetical protein